MKIVMLLVVIALCSCSGQKELARLKEKVASDSLNNWYTVQVSKLQSDRDKELSAVTVTLPEYNGIKDLSVVLALSVKRVNAEYDSALLILEKERRIKLDALGKMDEVKKKFLGLF